HQHVLLRLGELIAFAECASSMCRRATRFAAGNLAEKTNRRFNATAMSAMARIFAREAALKIAADGWRLVVGAGGVTDSEMAAAEARLKIGNINRAQVGLLADMDYIADVLFDRVEKAAAV
ncbi:MAG TPA: acyl-CoA dehydrogenase, partial [Terriglobales bacterium]|nr:acyl-CoA dehydrogenase [Terriglobales bacterium]